MSAAGGTRIPCWHDGRFASVEAPPWWAEEQDYLYSGGPTGTGLLREAAWASYGQPDAWSIEVLLMRDGRGYAVEFCDRNRAVATVWAQDDAALLDMLTSRALGWIRITGEFPIEETLINIKAELSAIRGELRDRLG